MLNIQVSTWLTVAAIVLGPVLALFTQRVLDRIREKKKQKLQIYLALMSTRAQPLAPAHVQALNAIDVVFNRRRRDRAIRAAWEKWLAHVMTDSKQPGWGERLNDLKVELLQAMGSAVGYEFDIDHLKRQSYIPVAHVDVEQEISQIRQTFAKVLTEEGLKVKIVGEQKPEPPRPQQVR